MARPGGRGRVDLPLAPLRLCARPQRRRPWRTAARARADAGGAQARPRHAETAEPGPQCRAGGARHPVRHPQWPATRHQGDVQLRVWRVRSALGPSGTYVHGSLGHGLGSVVHQTGSRPHARGVPGLAMRGRRHVRTPTYTHPACMQKSANSRAATRSSCRFPASTPLPTPSSA